MRLVALTATLLLLAPLPARAVGGSDTDPANQIDAATRTCQKQISKAALRYAGRTADAVQRCLDAILRCDEESDQLRALACRRKLLRPGKGRCAEGVIDEGVALVGPGSAAEAAVHASSKAALVRGYNKLVAGIDRRCSDPEVETGDGDTGLGFGSATTAAELADHANTDPGGSGCAATQIVLASTPRANEILALVEAFHETCVDGSVGAACAGDRACGDGGVCGRLAALLRAGESGSGLPECGAKVCGPGVADCGTRCANLGVDSQHCGACDQPCAADEICVASVCTACAAGELRCDEVCTDVLSNDSHCGSCGASCLPTQSCVGGVCQASGPIWQPAPGTSWQWQLQGTIDTSFDVAMYDVDLFDAPPATIAALRTLGRRVVCYFSAGSFEDWRPDAGLFPEPVKGNPLAGWPGERWLDIRDLATLGPIMEARLDLAAGAGCDGVEPDNVDGYSNASGFPLTAADQLAYNRFLAAAAHARGLSIGLKNDLGQVLDLVDDFDWALDEQCFQFDECQLLDPFVARGKAVFGVEYQGDPAVFCPVLNARGFSWLKKNLSLDAFRIDCADFP